MADHPHAVLYRDYLERLSVGDVDAVEPMIAPDVVWHEPGGELVIHGREALVAQMRAVTGGMEVRFEIHDVLANDEHTVTLYRMKVAAGGGELDARVAEIWHVSNGTVTERWTFVEDSQTFLDVFEAAGGA